MPRKYTATTTINRTINARQTIMMIICSSFIPPVLFSVPAGTPTVVKSSVTVLSEVVIMVIGGGRWPVFET